MFKMSAPMGVATSAIRCRAPNYQAVPQNDKLSVIESWKKLERSSSNILEWFWATRCMKLMNPFRSFLARSVVSAKGTEARAA